MLEHVEILPIPRLKRTFDFLASTAIVIALCPFMLLLLTMILLEQMVSPTARGPLLYKEIRISQGKPFMFYKIRTFKLASLANAHKNGTVHTKELESDFRNLTWMGLVLRQVYLDEFPQLFLVLVGKMSLVGPRPVNREEYERGLAGGIRAKTLLKAGLTGRFQTHKSKKYNLSQEFVDREYAKFCRENPGWKIVMHDSIILLQTILTIVRAEGL